MNCPKCQGDMQELVVEDQTVDRCQTCGGMWFDLREHERIAAAARAASELDRGNAEAAARHNELRDVNCPRCKVKMLRLVVPGQAHIQYESCPVCHGAYFDAGEFRAYASAGGVTGFLKGLFGRR